MAKRFTYEFEWDPTKAQDNLKKHRVAFERAATIFLDPEALDRTGVLLVVCHTYREETETSARIRLISARRPTKNEAKTYERK